MKNRLIYCVIVIGVVMQALASSSWATETEEVTLRDGTTYKVKVSTENGMPVPFKSRQIEVKGLGPVFSTSGSIEWSFNAQLHEKGTFAVTATTPLDSTISTTFECIGPGKIMQLFFGDKDYPKLWEWYDEPGTSWIPIVFSFTNKDSGSTFQVTQWTKFGPSVKVTVKRLLRAFKQRP